MAGALIECVAECYSYVFFTLAALLAGIVWLRNRSENSRAPPGPWGFPLVGHIPLLGKDPIPKLEEYRKTYGDVFSLRLGSYKAVVLNGANTIKTALTRRPDDFGDRPSLYSFQLIAEQQNGNVGLNVPFGPRWKVLRKIANSALRTFANYRTNPVEEIVAEEVNRLVDFFRSKGNTACDPSDEISLCVGSVIYQILFGRNANIRTDKNYCDMIRSSKDFVEFVNVGNPVDIMPWTRFFFKNRIEKFLKLVDCPYRVLAIQGEHHQATYDPDSIRDVIDALLKSSNDLSSEEKGNLELPDELIMSITVDLLGAGVGTVSSTLLWSIFYMNLYPNIQKKVQKEIDEQVGDSRSPTMEDKKHMPFVEATVCEIMRMASVVPLSVPRKTTVDVDLGDYTIPKDTFVMVNQYSTSMDRDVFGDPETFRPERFLTRDNTGHVCIDNTLAESFMSFGAGRRRCAGEFLAKVEIFLFFTLIMQRCTFSQSPEGLSEGREFGLTVNPKPYKTVVTVRE